MEIKYTLEILTKDIQDIEKLVGNLQNSPDGSTLELDLALSKLRNVYDILSVIRADMDAARITSHSDSPPAAQEAVAEEPATEPAVVKVESEAKSEPVKAEPGPDQPAAQAETVQPAKTPEPRTEPQAKSAAIIAEKFTAESSINENLAGSRDQGMDSKLSGQPIDSISRNIGINDRFLIIRELFDGDSESFGKLIDDLDRAGDLEAATNLLGATFEGTPEHEGLQILSGLVNRKYNKT